MTDRPMEDTSPHGDSPHEESSSRQNRWDDGEWGDAENVEIPQTRSGARQLALRALYWETANPGQISEALQQLGASCKLSAKLRFFAEQVAIAAVEHRTELDGLIHAKATNWRPERIARLDGLILRMALAELLYVEGVPARVTIHEAVELAKSYGGEKSFRFVNGLLDAIARDHKLEL